MNDESLVVVVKNSDDPRYQRVWRKEQRVVAAGMEGFYVFICVLYSCFRFLT